jgi:uncharacterized cupredoxin-like copper-binding protein
MERIIMRKGRNNILNVLFSTSVLLATPLYVHAGDKYGGREAVEIDIREWNLTLSKEKVKAGNVGFAVKNKGKETHEIAIIKLKNDAIVHVGRLPVDKHGAIDEGTMDFGEIVGEMEDIKSGADAKQLIKLDPGRYAVICNVVEQEADGSIEAHYSMGMHALLEVE